MSVLIAVAGCAAEEPRPTLKDLERAKNSDKKKNEFSPQFDAGADGPATEDASTSDGDDGDAIPDAGEHGPVTLIGPLTRVDGGGASDKGVELGPKDSALGTRSVCLHVRLEAGEYQVVPGTASPGPEYERVLNFARDDEGYRIYAAFPWQYDIHDWDETAGEVLPLRKELDATVFREGAILDVTFEVVSGYVDIHALAVTSLEP